MKMPPDASLRFERLETEFWEGGNWEDGTSLTLYRAKVPGGWFVCQADNEDGTGGCASFFYPDANHEWDGSNGAKASVANQSAQAHQCICSCWPRDVGV